MAKRVTKSSPKTTTESRYPKQDVLQSSEFTKIERDFLTAYLPNGDHTITEAKKVLEKIRKGAVK